MLSGDLQHYDSQLRQQEETIHDLRREIQRVGKESILDRRTGLYSWSFVLVRLEEEVIRSERYRHFLSLMLIHLDPPAAGSTEDLHDRMKGFAQMVNAGFARRTDVVGHYNKRQIVILMPETDPNGAEVVKDRVRALLEEEMPESRYTLLSFPRDASNFQLFLDQLSLASEKLERGAEFSRSF